MSVKEALNVFTLRKDTGHKQLSSVKNAVFVHPCMSDNTFSVRAARGEDVRLRQHMNEGDVLPPLIPHPSSVSSFLSAWSEDSCWLHSEWPACVYSAKSSRFCSLLLTLALPFCSFSRQNQMKDQAQQALVSPSQLPEEAECLTVPKYKRDLVQKLKILRQELSQQQPQAGHCRIEVSREEIFEVRPNRNRVNHGLISLNHTMASLIKLFYSWLSEMVWKLPDSLSQI